MAGYLGTCLGRPFDQPLPWIHDEHGGPNRDMWATADESSGYLIDLYRKACAHSDDVIADCGPDTPATVPWWPQGEQTTTCSALLARVLHDTSTHAGQLQILRELIDGQAGTDRADAGDDAWWAAYRERLEATAKGFLSQTEGSRSEVDAHRM